MHTALEGCPPCILPHQLWLSGWCLRAVRRCHAPAVTDDSCRIITLTIGSTGGGTLSECRGHVRRKPPEAMAGAWPLQTPRLRMPLHWRAGAW
eukprot:COSAG01_NODE_48629_length_379_cov_1.078571_1_plen_92_part_01